MILISDDIPRFKSIRIEAWAPHQAQSQTQPFLSTILEDFSEQMDLNLSEPGKATPFFASASPNSARNDLSRFRISFFLYFA